MEFNIRFATEEDDTKLLIRIGEAMYEGPYKTLQTYAPERAKAVLAHMRSLGPQGAILLVAETPEKEIVGTFLAMVTYTTAGLEPVASEILWWVAPEARKTRMSILFIHAFETWARKLGVTKTILGSMENDHAESIDKFYKKRGYVLTERTYFKELN